MKYLDKDGLEYYNGKIQTKLNAKQNTLTSQTAYSSKGSATKVPQITTNSLGQVTNISEVTITQPTVNNATLTIQKNGTSVGTFTANASTNATANITVPTKTSEITNDSGFLVNSNTYINTHPENSPVVIPFIHNDIGFLLKRGGSSVVKYDGTAQTIDLSNVFDGSPSYWATNPTGTAEIVIELTLHKTFIWTNTIYCDFGSSSWRAKNVQVEVINSNYSSDTWSNKLNLTNNGSGNVKTTFSHTPIGASNAGAGFNKIRFTFSNWNNATIFRIAQIGVYNYGSLGVRETYMSRGIDDEVYRNITPNSNNTFLLGSSSKKWANIYATTFTGNLSGNASTATKATQDASGNVITTTYATKSELPTKVSDLINDSGYTSNTGTITGVSINSSSIATSGVADIKTNGTYNASSNKIATMSDIPSLSNYYYSITSYDSTHHSLPIVRQASAFNIPVLDNSTYKLRMDNIPTASSISNDSTTVPTTEAVNSALSYYATNSDLTTARDEIYSSVYTQTEINNLIQPHAITIYNSAEGTASTSTTWAVTKFSLTGTLSKVGSKLSISNGAVLVGSGVNHVKISGSALIKGASGTVQAQIFVGGTRRTMAYNYTSSTGQYMTCSMVPMIIAVSSGQSIELRVGGSSAATYTMSGGGNTYLTVEVVD